MGTADKIAARRKAYSERDSRQQVGAWTRRRAWTRNDSARWLNDHAPAVMAQLLYLRATCPRSDGTMRRLGSWLKEEAPDRSLFDRAHLALAAFTNNRARAAALVTEILR